MSSIRILPDGGAGRRHRWIGAATALVGLVGGSLALGAPPSSDATVKELWARELAAGGAKQVQVETVEYGPGGKSRPHQHHAQVFVYVLKGSLRMQVQGGPLVTLRPGDTFFEAPNDVHVVSENASQTESARFLVVMIKNK
jgi:quercetin dioxygenase-like cupin family protein